MHEIIHCVKLLVWIYMNFSHDLKCSAEVIIVAVALCVAIVISVTLAPLSIFDLSFGLSKARGCYDWQTIQSLTLSPHPSSPKTSLGGVLAGAEPLELVWESFKCVQDVWSSLPFDGFEWSFIPGYSLWLWMRVLLCLAVCVCQKCFKSSGRALMIVCHFWL